MENFIIKENIRQRRGFNLALRQFSAIPAFASFFSVASVGRAIKLGKNCRACKRSTESTRGRSRCSS